MRSLQTCSIRHPWDAGKHLEGIVNGTDTLPRLIKYEFPCHGTNTNDLVRILGSIRFDTFALHIHYCKKIVVNPI